MKFVVEQSFDRITPAAYQALYFDETFCTALGTSLGLGRTLVRFDRTATHLVRHVRCTPSRAPTSEAAQVLDDRASFVEELEYDLRTACGTWRTIPSVFADRVSNRGTLEFVASDGGTRRIVRGEVTVRIFGVGGLVERKIVAEIENSYTRAARFTAEWLAQSDRSHRQP